MRVDDIYVCICARALLRVRASAFTRACLMMCLWHWQGERKDRHQRILMLSPTDLHTEFPWTEALVFNESMKKGEFSEAKIKNASAPKTSCIFGSKEGKSHAWIIGNEEGEILPKFLMQKFITIESGKVFGNVTTIVTGDTERDRLFAMVREAQHRGIQPLAIKEIKAPKRAPAAGVKPKPSKKAKQAAVFADEEEDADLAD